MEKVARGMFAACLAGWFANSAFGGLSAAQPATPGQEAQRLLREQRVGVLATRSVVMSGYPFASLTPYALDRRGRPLILISTLSEHTRNIVAGDRVSMLVYDTTDRDVHEAARLTWIGRAVRVPAEDASAWARYKARFPESERFFKAHDFRLYRIEPVRGYYIGGFGRIFWIEPSDLVVRASSLPHWLLA